MLEITNGSCEGGGIYFVSIALIFMLEITSRQIRKDLDNRLNSINFHARNN